MLRHMEMFYICMHIYINIYMYIFLYMCFNDKVKDLNGFINVF